MTPKRAPRTQSCQSSSHCWKERYAIRMTAPPLIRSVANIRLRRGSRSTATPPNSRQRSIGVVEQINTTPIAVAEPVFCRTHQASAIVKRLSPKRETVCPLHSKAKARLVNARNTAITIPFSLHKETEYRQSHSFSEFDEVTEKRETGSEGYKAMRCPKPAH